jgi:hypothetical protein
MRPFIKVALPLAAVSAAALLLHRRAGSLGQTTAGGVLIRDAATYDRLAGWLLGSFYDGAGPGWGSATLWPAAFAGPPDREASADSRRSPATRP